MLDRRGRLGNCVPDPVGKTFMRVAYLISAAMPGVLERVPLEIEDRRLVLHLPPDLGDLSNERLFNRLRQLGKLLGREATIVVDVPR